MQDVVTCDQASVELVPTFTPAQILWNTGATTPTITVSEEGIYSFLAIGSAWVVRSPMMPRC